MSNDEHTYIGSVGSVGYDVTGELSCKITLSLLPDYDATKDLTAILDSGDVVDIRDNIFAVPADNTLDLELMKTMEGRLFVFKADEKLTPSSSDFGVKFVGWFSLDGDLFDSSPPDDIKQGNRQVLYGAGNSLDWGE